MKSVAKFKQTQVNGGSIYDFLKVTSSECQSSGNLKHAWVNDGHGHDSLKVASALTVKVMEIQTSVVASELWLRDDLENIYALLFRFLGYGFRLAMSNVGWLVTQKFVILVPDPIGVSPSWSLRGGTRVSSGLIARQIEELVPTERDKYVWLVQSRRRPEKWTRTRKAGLRGSVTPDPVS